MLQHTGDSKDDHDTNWKETLMFLRHLAPAWWCLMRHEISVGIQSRSFRPHALHVSSVWHKLQTFLMYIAIELIFIYIYLLPSISLPHVTFFSLMSSLRAFLEYKSWNCCPCNCSRWSTGRFLDDLALMGVLFNLCHKHRENRLSQVTIQWIPVIGSDLTTPEKFICTSFSHCNYNRQQFLHMKLSKNWSFKW